MVLDIQFSAASTFFDSSKHQNTWMHHITKDQSEIHLPLRNFTGTTCKKKLRKNWRLSYVQFLVGLFVVAGALESIDREHFILLLLFPYQVYQ